MKVEDYIPPEKRFKLILSVYLILIKESKILLLRRANTGYEDGKYGLPSGHADGGESARSATAREVQEEIGLKIKPGDLEFVQFMHRIENDERADVFFTAEKWEGEPKNLEPNRCDDVSWFPLDGLPENTIPYIRQAIECYQKGIFYFESGRWEGNT